MLPPELARVLGWNIARVYRWIWSGKIKAQKFKYGATRTTYVISAQEANRIIKLHEKA